MPDRNSEALVKDFEKKFSALRNKIVLHQSLVTTLTVEFESLYSDFESLKLSFGSTKDKVESTSFYGGVTSEIIESTSEKFSAKSNKIGATSEKYESTSNKIGATSNNFESTSSGDGATSFELLADGIIRSAAGLKIYFGQPSIPLRLAQILLSISEKKSLSVTEIRAITGASRNSVTRDMKILKQLGWVKFNGSRKNGRFTLTEEGIKAAGFTVGY
jgi:hypothetical protein